MTDRFMKRIFLNLFVAASLFTFCGCEDYLNVESKSYLDDPAMFSDPETAVMGTAFHAFEWLFVRIAPFVFAGALAGIVLTREKA